MYLKPRVAKEKAERWLQLGRRRFSLVPLEIGGQDTTTEVVRAYVVVKTLKESIKSMKLMQ